MDKNCESLKLTTAINSLAVAISTKFNDEDLALIIAIISQLSATLTTIIVQHELIDKCEKNSTTYNSKSCQ